MALWRFRGHGFRAGILMALLITIASLPSNVPGGKRVPALTRPNQSCTVFYAADGDTILAGNNEDMFDPLTVVWFIPASEGKHGRILFGFDDFIPQGGVNDQGLFYDGLSVPYQAITHSSDKITLSDPWMLLDKVLAEAATVGEAVKLLDGYNRVGFESSQLFYGDRLGNSVIVEGNAIIPKTGKFQVVTNFRQSEASDLAPPDERFSTATHFLSDAPQFTVQLFRDTLEAVHVEGEISTVYSQVYDLKQGVIYLYLFHNYAQVVILNVAEELAKGPHSATIDSLFPRDEARERWAAGQMQTYNEALSKRPHHSVDPQILDDYSGDYHLSEGQGSSLARVFTERGKLYLQKDALLPIELYAASDQEFSHLYYLGDELRLTFMRDAAGRVSGADGSYTFMNYSQPVRLERTRAPKSVSPGADGLWLISALAAAALLMGILRRFSSQH